MAGKAKIQEGMHEGRKGIFVITPYDPQFIDALKREIPWTERAWVPSQKRWWVSQFFVEEAVALIIQFFGQPEMVEEPDPFQERESAQEKARKAEEARRKAEEEYRRQQQQQRGNGKYVDPSYAVLYIAPNAPIEVVKAAYRALALKHHPDHGGDVRVMQALNEAYETIMKTLG